MAIAAPGAGDCRRPGARARLYQAGHRALLPRACGARGKRTESVGHGRSGTALQLAGRNSRRKVADMSESDDQLARIAAAIEQLGPPTAMPAEWLIHPAYVWSGEGVREFRAIEAPELAQLRGIDKPKSRTEESRV